MSRVLLIGRQGPLSDAVRASSLLREHEVAQCSGDVEALRFVRKNQIDVVVTDPDTSIAEDIALAKELATCRPGVRIIALAPDATHEEITAALRAHVFACFTPPFEPAELVDMIGSALAQPEWQDGIDIISSLPHWLTLRVSCHLLSADRLVRFMTEHLNALPEDQRDLLIAAFRELLLNAMEHGAHFDSSKVIEVTAARTGRAIVYYLRDPGKGFGPDALARAAASPDPEEVVGSGIRRAELGLRPGGFGMLIARQVADELVYNERGNEVLLIKYLDR